MRGTPEDADQHGPVPPDPVRAVIPDDVGPAGTPVRLLELSATTLRARMGEALAVYVRAMGYASGTESHRAPMWAEHALRPAWRAFAAVAGADEDRGGRIVGIAYGYRIARGQWWAEEVRSGLVGIGRSAAAADEFLTDSFELTELHVDPDAQGHRLGERLLAALLSGRPERRVLLSTPEVAGEDNRAWRLYRRWGFTDVLRGFTFTGDARPFAVLATDLPVRTPQA